MMRNFLFLFVVDHCLRDWVNVGVKLIREYMFVRMVLGEAAKDDETGNCGRGSAISLDNSD